MLIHDQNLRYQQLNTLFKNCGITDLTKWLENHRLTKEFFGAETRMTASVERELLTLVEYRNDAAHGALTVADVIGVDLLAELADFVMLLCNLLAERVQKSVLENGASKGLSSFCGNITEIFRGGTVIVALVTGQFEVGQSIYLVGENYCTERRIENIQIDNVDTSPTTVTEQAELGMKLDGKGKIGGQIYTMSALSPEQVGQ